MRHFLSALKPLVHFVFRRAARNHFVREKGTVFLELSLHSDLNSEVIAERVGNNAFRETDGHDLLFARENEAPLARVFAEANAALLEVAFNLELLSDERGWVGHHFVDALAINKGVAEIAGEQECDNCADQDEENRPDFEGAAALFLVVFVGEQIGGFLGGFFRHVRIMIPSPEFRNQ